MEALVANAIKGRGLWIGLFPEFSEALTSAIKTVHASIDTEQEFSEIMIQSKMHVTIAHLGKKNSIRDTELAVTSTELASSLLYGEDVVSVEGLLRLPNHIGFLIDPSPILKIKHAVLASLSDRHLTPDQSFVGIPHMTIGKMKYPRDCRLRIPYIKPFSLTFRSLAVVCGEERVNFPFMSDPF